MRFKSINTEQLDEMIYSQKIEIFDIRNKESFVHSHIPRAVHLTEENLPSIFNSYAKDQLILVYCYHGISSQLMAQRFVDHGFSNMYSLTGGFAVWKDAHPQDAI